MPIDIQWTVFSGVTMQLFKQYQIGFTMPLTRQNVYCTPFQSRRNRPESNFCMPLYRWHMHVAFIKTCIFNEDDNHEYLPLLGA